MTNSTAGEAVAFQYETRQARIPVTATARIDIPIVSMAETPICTVAKGSELIGEVRGDGFFYFVCRDETSGRRTECRIPFKKWFLSVQYRNENESET